MRVHTGTCANCRTAPSSGPAVEAGEGLWVCCFNPLGCGCPPVRVPMHVRAAGEVCPCCGAGAGAQAVAG